MSAKVSMKENMPGILDMCSSYAKVLTKTERGQGFFWAHAAHILGLTLEEITKLCNCNIVCNYQDQRYHNLYLHAS